MATALPEPVVSAVTGAGGGVAGAAGATGEAGVPGEAWVAAAAGIGRSFLVVVVASASPDLSLVQPARMRAKAKTVNSKGANIRMDL
ncbi:MAG: hypothetical protein HY790_12350 [Deltaproteobacteria bacterium]|nr:hypothetical protein [Deltaproteobacteria bacterium]